MAFYIDLDKISETQEYVRYKYYTSEENVGIIECRKSDGHMFEIQAAPNDSAGYIFQRAGFALMACWREKEYPEKTCWAT